MHNTQNKTKKNDRKVNTESYAEERCIYMSAAVLANIGKENFLKMHCPHNYQLMQVVYSML